MKPKGKICSIFYSGVDSNIPDRGLWLRQDPWAQEERLGNVPPVEITASSSWTGQGANITHLFLPHKISWFFFFVFTSFYENNIESQFKMGLKLNTQKSGNSIF